MWDCDLCGRKFSRKFNLQRHLTENCLAKKVLDPSGHDPGGQEPGGQDSSGQQSGGCYEESLGLEVPARSFAYRPLDFNKRNRLNDMSDRLPEESLAAWKKRKFFPPRKSSVTLDPVERAESNSDSELTEVSRSTNRSLGPTGALFDRTASRSDILLNIGTHLGSMIRPTAIKTRSDREGSASPPDSALLGSAIGSELELSQSSELVRHEETALDKFRQEVLERLKALEKGKRNNGKGNGGEGESGTGDGGADGPEGPEPKIDIVCLAKGDYIKKLIQLHDGDEEKAMNYIKNVGIATDFLECDFRLIKKVYFDGKKKSQFPIRVKDFKRNKLEYLEENGEWILDIRGEIVGKRLCDNLVNTLLIANSLFNDVIIHEEDEDKKQLLLDLFQINRTQEHILKLMERKTQGKLSRRVAEFIHYCSEVHAETGSLDNVKKAYEG